MFVFLAKPRLLRHVYKTKAGVQCPMFHREGTSDWNTLMAALEEDEYHLHELGLKPGDTAVDIGSHIGGISTLLATLGVRVYSVEALPENAALQKKNLALNGRQAAVTVLHRAISGSDEGCTRLFYGDVKEKEGKHHEFIGTSADYKHFFGKGRHVDVPRISVAGVFKKCGIGRCKLLKIDVEGAEWEALAGIPDDVLSRIDYVLGEWHVVGEGRSRADLLRLLRGKFEDVSDRHGAPANDFVFRRIGA